MPGTARRGAPLPLTTSSRAKVERSLARAVTAVLAAIALGLASRRFPAALPSFVGKYPGDALWASMVFFGWAAVFRRAPTRHVALIAGVTAASVEGLKLWSSPAWTSVRQSTIGHLVFGHVFSWQNLVAYAVGVAIAAACDRLLVPRAPPARAGTGD